MGTILALRWRPATGPCALLLEKSPAELTELPDAALSLLSIGPESGDDRVLQRNTRADHVEVVRRAHEADLCR